MVGVTLVQTKQRKILFILDNVFLRGHIADEETKLERHCKQQYIPGYLAMFL